MKDPILMEFPLRGEWYCPNTPGTKVPSHGTNKLGARYAYDFIQVDWNRIGYPAYRVSLPRYLLLGVDLSDYYCWGQKYIRLAMALLSSQWTVIKSVPKRTCFWIFPMHAKTRIIAI